MKVFKKMAATIMALTMLASMSTGVFAENYRSAPYESENDVIVLGSGPQERINISTTGKFARKVWKTVARTNNILSESIVVKILNINGVDEVRVQVVKNGDVCDDFWLGIDEQHTFHVDCDDGEYLVRFCTQEDATVTYSIKTV